MTNTRWLFMPIFIVTILTKPVYHENMMKKLFPDPFLKN